MTWPRKPFISLLALTVALLGLGSPARAGPKMYSGTLIFHAFGYYLGYGYTGCSLGGACSYFTAIPLGNFCNNALTMKSPPYTRKIATVYLAPRSSLAMYCNETVRRQGSPITGSGTASTFTMIMTSMGSSLTLTLPGFTIPQSGIAGTISGSFAYGYPYIYSVSYATLANAAGSFLPGGGSGTTSVSRATPFSGTAMIWPRYREFGGSMRLLGQVTSKGFYFSGGYGSFGSWPWLFELAGASYRGPDCPGTTSPPYAGCPSVATTRRTVTDGNKNRAYTAMGMETYPITTRWHAFADAFRWTTGSVAVAAPGGYYNTFLFEIGFDGRTSMGAGTIQLVTPHLVNWINPPLQRPPNVTASIAILRLRFVPESATWLLLAAGIGLLAVLHRRRSR